jgi:hypothetical protein
MSYSMTIKAKNGTVTVTTTGEVPDGEHTIAGFEDGGTVSLHAERRDALGRYMIHANHSHNIKQLEQAVIAQPQVTDDPDR